MRRTAIVVPALIVGMVALVLVGGATAKKPALSATPVFKLNLKPNQEVPPIKGLKASAVGSVTFDLERSATGTITSGEVIFYFNYSFPNTVNITGLHVHVGAKGTAPPNNIVVNSGVASFTDADGHGNITAVVTGRHSHDAGHPRRSEELLRQPAHERESDRCAARADAQPEEALIRAFAALRGAVFPRNAANIHPISARRIQRPAKGRRILVQVSPRSLRSATFSTFGTRRCVLSNPRSSGAEGPMSVPVGSVCFLSEYSRRLRATT